MDTLSRERGYAMCALIREQNRRRPISFSALWCRRCTTFTGGDPEKRCGKTYECPQVIERFKREARQETR